MVGCVLAALAPAPAVAAELPDLEQVAPYEVRTVHREGRWFLGFATAVRNVGAAALRIRGEGTGSGAMAARQLSEDGVEVLNPDVGTLRYVSTSGHQHWHYMDFMRYELRGLDTPGVLVDHKQGFCLGDAPAFVDGWCAANQPALTTTDVGIRPGGIDVYTPFVEGQEIPIDRDSTPSGRYVLSSRIGPTGVVRETRTGNNVASTVIALRWPLRHGRVLTPLRSCVGRRCAGRLPALPAHPRRMSARDARRLARRALRQTTGRSAANARVRCHTPRRRGRLCSVRLRFGRLSFRGTVRVWYALEGAATRWHYDLDVVRRVEGCLPDGCALPIQAERVGGTVRTRVRARAADRGLRRLVCRIRT